MAKITEVPIEPFKSALGWEKWLLKNHSSKQGVWLKIAKKASGFASVTYDEALDAALCYGWIDGQKRSFDENYFLQKFTPRRPKSIWSKRNKEHIERLIKDRRMKPAGLKESEMAKKDGRWDSAYDSSSAATIPTDFLKSLSKNKNAKAFFDTLNKANRYSIAWRLQTAKKPETRDKRMEQILEMLEQHKKFHQ